MGGGNSGYSPVPQRFDAPDVATPAARLNNSPATTRSPAFKGTGMKLGTKKTKQAELLDALGGDVLASSSIGELSVPSTPINAPETVSQSVAPKSDGRGSLPEVDAERSASFYHRHSDDLLTMTLTFLVSILSSRNRSLYLFYEMVVCSLWSSRVT